MFAIAFDLIVKETLVHHPKSVSQAYTDIGAALSEFGFDRVRGRLYTTETEDLANLFGAPSPQASLVVPSLAPRHPRVQGRAMVRCHVVHATGMIAA